MNRWSSPGRWIFLFATISKEDTGCLATKFSFFSIFFIFIFLLFIFILHSVHFVLIFFSCLFSFFFVFPLFSILPFLPFRLQPSSLSYSVSSRVFPLFLFSPSFLFFLVFFSFLFSFFLFSSFFPFLSSPSFCSWSFYVLTISPLILPLLTQLRLDPRNDATIVSSVYNLAGINARLKQPSFTFNLLHWRFDALDCNWKSKINHCLAKLATCLRFLLSANRFFPSKCICPLHATCRRLGFFFISYVSSEMFTL